VSDEEKQEPAFKSHGWITREYTYQNSCFTRKKFTYTWITDLMEKSNSSSRKSSQTMRQLLQEIGALPDDWHAAGTMGSSVLHAIARHVGNREIMYSAETGSGKTTLLFSHLSREHKVFALEGDNRSITVVRDSPLLNRSTVEFIEGPTQATMPQYHFGQKLQLVLIDGPHGYPFPEMEYFYFYPHLDKDALLLVDDIHIPTIHRLYEFLKEDEMFRLVEVVDNTAFFVRNDRDLFDPHGDGWWLQEFNKRRFPVRPKKTTSASIRGWVGRYLPGPVKKAIKRVIGRS
jgi:hypothetical protein